MYTILALFSLTTSGALAADAYNAHGFSLVPSDGDLHDPLGMWRPELQVKRSFGVSALAEYAKAPLVQYTSSAAGTTSQTLVDNLIGVNVGGAYAVSRRVALTLALPLYINAEDALGESQPAVGDLRFAAPIGLIVPRTDEQGKVSDGLHFLLSAIPFANIPTGNVDLYLGSGGFGGGGVLAAGLGNEAWQLFANGGAEVTPAVYALANLNGGTFLKANLGTSVRIAENLAFRLEGTLNMPLVVNEVPWTESPSEAILSARYRADSGLNFTVGGATAITPGAGAARYRAFLGGGWTFGKEPVQVVEPVVVAPLDPCGLVVTVVDPTGAPIPGAVVTAQNRTSTSGPKGRATFETCTVGLSDTLTATAPTYQPGTADSFELKNGPNERTIVLTPMDSQLKVIVLDDKGLPHDARIRFLEGPADQGVVQVGPDGEETMTLKPGEWTVLVASPTHVPQEARVTLDPGEFETLNIRFTSDKPYNVCDEVVVLRDVNFDFDIDTPKEGSVAILRSIASSLKDCPDVVVEVGGHTDSKGTDAYNLDLSQRRMNSVKEILVGYGVAGRRLKVTGYGESMPVATNGTEAGRAQNRRVEFVPSKPTPAEKR